MKTLRWQHMLGYGVVLIIMSILVGHFEFHREPASIAGDCTDIIIDFLLVWFVVARKE